MSPWLFLIAFALIYRFDGYLFPVVETMHQIQEEDITKHSHRKNWLVVSGNFIKKRNCVFTGIEWFMLDPQTEAERVRILVRFEDKPEIRDTGHQEFSELAINLDDPEIILQDSKAYVYHDCYGGLLWETRTLFYDARH